MLSAGLENTREFLKLPNPAKKRFYVQEVQLHLKKVGTLNGKMLLLRAGKLSKS